MWIFANNVWKWNLSRVEIHDNEAGGFEVELPRVNDIFERQTHAVEVQQCNMHNNRNFAFGVDGYFAVVKIAHNTLKENNCLRGCC